MRTCKVCKRVFRGDRCPACLTAIRNIIMPKKGTKTPSETARPPHQFNLSQSEFDSIYELADLPKQVSKGAALRQALLNHREQITENANLKLHLRHLSESEEMLKNQINTLDLHIKLLTK